MVEKPAEKPAQASARIEEPARDASGDEIRRPALRDPAVLRALAHPARMEIMERLMNGDPATATECAEIAGLSPSATSYHLRAMAKVRLVEQAPSRGDARERLWRSTISGYSIDPTQEVDPEVRAAAWDLVSAVLIRDETRVQRWLAHADREPREWSEVTTFNDSVLVLTAQELKELTDEVIRTVRRYSKRTRTDPPPGSRTVSAMFRAFPLDEAPPVDAPQPSGG